jgi:DNA polymerase elongation subunit (family B)
MQVLDRITEQYVDQLALVFPDKSREELENYVQKKVQSTLKDRNVIFNDGEKKNQQSLLDFTEFLEVEKPIISGYGAVYKKHNEGKNMLADMFDYLLASRKKVKKEMFKHVNDKDRSVYNNLDLSQKTYKLLANSGYGATVEKNSIFYNENFGPSITYTGVVIITTAVNAFETFMSNNFDFTKINDVLNYIKNIVSQPYANNDIIDINITKKELLTYLFDKLQDKTQENMDILVEIVKRLNQEETNKIFYKNNLYKLFENKAVMDKLEKIAGKKEFLDPNEPPEEILGELNMLWSYLEDWVLYNHLNFYRMRNAETKKRKTVLIVDTDSNFLMLDPFYKYFLEKFPSKIDKTDESKVSTVNVATYLLANVIEKAYWKMTTEMNIPADKRTIINMKNEFFYKRLMTTRNKKSYGGLLIMQEGHMFEKPKMDIKGLAIRKVSVNYNVREFFTNMLKDEILTSETINLGKVFGSFMKLQKDIERSLRNGEIDYVQPGKVNEMESYANPYRMQTLRGAIIWNALFPDQEIVLPTKVNMIKLTADSLESIANKIPMEEYEIIKRTIFDNPEMAKYGFTTLSMPKSAKKIPEWITPYIDVDTMVNDHVKSGIIMLESLGFKTLDILDSQFPTNVLNF